MKESELQEFVLSRLKNDWNIYYEVDAPINATPYRVDNVIVSKEFNHIKFGIEFKGWYSNAENFYNKFSKHYAQSVDYARSDLGLKILMCPSIKDSMAQRGFERETILLMQTIAGQQNVGEISISGDYPKIEILLCSQMVYRIDEYGSKFSRTFTKNKNMKMKIGSKR